MNEEDGVDWFALDAKVRAALADAYAKAAGRALPVHEVLPAEVVRYVYD